MHIDGVVVLYNPKIAVLHNIESYRYRLRHLYVVDNSTQKDNLLLEEIRKLQNVCYIDNQGNKGIAHALNVAICRARENNADWLLTMDQDSCLDDDNLKRLIASVDDVNISETGIISPVHLILDQYGDKVESGFYNSYVKQNKLDSMYTSLLFTMTAGNLLNLSVVDRVGLFDESFFIDEVDHDYCLRLNVNNYLVLENNTAVLNHKLGNTCRKNFFGLAFSVTNHSWIRRYYCVRNYLMLRRRYKKYYPLFFRKRDVVEIRTNLKAILFEQDRLKKLFAIIRGIFHFLNNTTGPCNESI